MRKWMGAGLLCAVLAGCGLQPRQQAPWIDAAMAVQLAAAAGPGRGVDGVFALTVQRTGEDRGRLFLGSQRDYRDPRNLGIALEPPARRQLAARLQAQPETVLQGKQILVRGRARLVRIDFIDGQGRPSGKYYYQTQVRVSDAAQIQLR